MSKILENKSLVFNLLRIFLFTIFLVVFFIMMADVWLKFVSKMTSTGVTFRSDNDSKNGKKFLPSFTVCPWPVYRTKGLHFRPEDFKKNTFDLEEILTNENNLTNFKNDSMFSIIETWSVHYGRCYTLNYKVNKNIVLQTLS